VDFQLDLSLKVGIGTQIFKFHELRWNAAFRRWQREADAEFPWPSGPLVELELYHKRESAVPVVVAEGAIPAAGISSALQREIRIVLLLLVRVCCWTGSAWGVSFARFLREARGRAPRGASSAFTR